MESAYDAYREMAVGAEEVYSDVSAAYEDVSVVESFCDQEQIEEILQCVYPSAFQYDWHSYEEFDYNYDVCIEFKKDSDYPYNKIAYYFHYNILAGQVPEFVVEATALK